MPSFATCSALAYELICRGPFFVRVGITTGFEGAAGAIIVILGGLGAGRRFEALVELMCRVPGCLIEVGDPPWSFSTKVGEGEDE